MFDFYNKQQVSTYATTILQLDNIHRSAMRFIVYTTELDGEGTTSGIIIADETKTRTNKEKGVWKQRGDPDLQMRGVDTDRVHARVFDPIVCGRRERKSRGGRMTVGQVGRGRRGSGLIGRKR